MVLALTVAVAVAEAMAMAMAVTSLTSRGDFRVKTGVNDVLEKCMRACFIENLGNQNDFER